MKFTKKMLELYAITDRAWVGRQTLCEQIESALKGGATIVQLREKNLTDAEFIDEAVEVKSICRRYNVPLIINDRVEVALKSGANGVHVGIEDTPVSEIRRRVPEDFIIGATCKSVEQAAAAKAAGADYMGVGAVFLSPTKTNARRVTIHELNEICASVEIPAVAIGGITGENLCELAGSKIAGIAVVSAIFGAEDIEAACSDLRLKLKSVLTGAKP